MKSYECNLVKNLPAVPKISNFFTQKIMPWRSPDFLSIFNGRLFWTGMTQRKERKMKTFTKFLAGILVLFLSVGTIHRTAHAVLCAPYPSDVGMSCLNQLGGCLTADVYCDSPSCTGYVCSCNTCSGSTTRTSQGTQNTGSCTYTLYTCYSPPCTPNCTGKNCGDGDGCGGKCVMQTCGTCKTCNSSGACASVSDGTTCNTSYVCCNGSCCTNSSQTCVSSVCTTPCSCSCADARTSAGSACSSASCTPAGPVSSGQSITLKGCGDTAGTYDIPCNSCSCT